MFLVPMTRTTSELGRAFDRMFDDRVFDRFFVPTARAGDGMRAPALDVAESDKSYTIKLDMPGVAKEDVKVTVEGRRVTVQAETGEKEEKKQGDRVVYSERSMASYARSFLLPTEVDQREATAKLENGVLELTLPKRGPASGAQIAIN